MLPKNLLREPGNTIDWIFYISNCSHVVSAPAGRAPRNMRSFMEKLLHAERGIRYAMEMEMFDKPWLVV